MSVVALEPLPQAASVASQVPIGLLMVHHSFQGSASVLLILLKIKSCGFGLSLIGFLGCVCACVRVRVSVCVSVCSHS